MLGLSFDTKSNVPVFTMYLNANILFIFYVRLLHSRSNIHVKQNVFALSPFSFRTALILRGIDSTRCWKHSSEILVHIDMIASHSCCRFVGYTSMMWISRSPHPKAALLDWDLVTVEAIWVKWTHCHVQETSLRWFELCDFEVVAFRFKIQSVYCHVHSEERQVSLYNKILSLLSTLNVKTSPNYVKIKTDMHR